MIIIFVNNLGCVACILKTASLLTNLETQTHLVLNQLYKDDVLQAMQFPPSSQTVLLIATLMFLKYDLKIPYAPIVGRKKMLNTKVMLRISCLKI